MILHKNKNAIEILRFQNQHKECGELFRVRYENRKQKIIVVYLIPDLILVDFETREIYGVEIANQDQLHIKKLKYHKSEFDGFIYVRTKGFEFKKPRIVLK